MDFKQLKQLSGLLGESDRPGGALKRRAGADDHQLEKGKYRLAGKAGHLQKGQEVGEVQKQMWDFIRRIKDDGENQNDVKQEVQTVINALDKTVQQKALSYFETNLQKYSGS